MDWYNLLVIGAGQLGSRHLQGLLKSDLSFRIIVVDPSEENSSKAERLIRGQALLSNRKEIKFCRSLDETDKILYVLAIISTNSDVRLNVVKEMLNKRRIKNMILEKVVFQKPGDFKTLEKLLKSEKIKTWVNCPRRLYPVYNEIKELLENEQCISMTVKGGNWGLGGNAVHFIDLFLFLVRSGKITPAECILDKGILKSKREGFLEFSGTLNFSSSVNNLSICSAIDSVEPITVTIESSNFRIIVNESFGKMSILKRITGEFNENLPFVLPFQSDLTGRYANDIIGKREPGLVSIEESAGQHIILLEILTEHLSKVTGVNYLFCPIT